MKQTPHRRFVRARRPTTKHTIPYDPQEITATKIRKGQPIRSLRAAAIAKKIYQYQKPTLRLVLIKKRRQERTDDEGFTVRKRMRRNSMEPAESERQASPFLFGSGVWEGQVSHVSFKSKANQGINVPLNPAVLEGEAASECTSKGI